MIGVLLALGLFEPSDGVAVVVPPGREITFDASLSREITFDASLSREIEFTKGG